MDIFRELKAIDDLISKLESSPKKADLRQLSLDIQAVALKVEKAVFELQKEHAEREKQIEASVEAKYRKRITDLETKNHELKAQLEKKNNPDKPPVASEAMQSFNRRIVRRGI